VQLAVADVDEGRDRSTQVQQRVQLDGRLGRTKWRPLEQAQTQIDGAGVQRVDRSLDDTVGDSEDAPTYADLVDAEQGRESGGQGSFDPADIRIDVTEVMSRLTPEQRRLCDLLGAQGLSINEASEKLRIPRATLYEEIKRIRKIFALHGLDDYLQP
jgi:DNA-directed RNA polymerase specialized sigma24 family protein